MSWTELAPIVRTVPNAKAAIVILTDGLARVNISFSEPFFREIGEPEKCAVQAGSAENLGKVRIVLGEGPFDLREFQKGGGKIQIPLPVGILARVRDIEPCEVLERSTQAVILALPIDAWSKQGGIAREAPKAVEKAPEKVEPMPWKAPSSAPAKQVPAQRVGAGRSKLDASDYLRGKGMRCSRLAGDFYQVNGERLDKTTVLGHVNFHRKKAELPVLGLADID